MPTGVLPIQLIRQLMRKRFIKGISEAYLNPASLDLPCSAECYRMERTFHVGKGETVRSKIKEAGGRPFDLKNPLEVGMLYLIRIDGTIKLPKSVYAYANPKSSTGRVFLLTRLMSDGAEIYDAIPAGGKGELWVLVRPETFSVIVHPGIALSQIRLFDGKAFLDKFALEVALEEPGLFFSPAGKRLRDENEGVRFHGDSFLLTIGLPRGVAGWECVRATELLDLGRTNFYKPENFFRPVFMRNGKLDLVQGGHYILTTHEHLRLPPDCAAELRAMDPRFGEFRSHSAGFFDPGWGMKSRGQPITLEISAFEHMTVVHGQPIARVRYERMKEVPTVLYHQARSNYKGQVRGAKLSKHFKVKKAA